MNALRRRDLEISNAVHTRTLWEQFQTLIDMAPIPIYAKDSSHRYSWQIPRPKRWRGPSEGGHRESSERPYCG
jgi:hypothetical protein